MKTPLVCAAVVVPVILWLTRRVWIEWRDRLSSAVVFAHANDLHTVRRARQMCTHAAFYGSFMAGVLGYQRESSAALVVAALWFGLATYLSYSLVKRLQALDEREVRYV
jgi:hypothetical protein